VGTELQKVEPPRGKLPALKMSDPAFLVGRLRAGKSAGFLSRQARRRRVGARQFLVNEVGLAVKKGVFVWAVVTQGEPERFRDLAAVPKKLREGIDQFTLEEFSTVSPLHFMPFEIVVVFEEPIELKKPPPGRRFASEIEIAEARKGFPNSVVEGGIHVHTLDRDKKTTREDGAHTHLFALPDGKTIVTEEDGVHTHALANSGANKSAEDGAHTHRVRMPDGSIVETVAGGNHAHQLQVFYSAFDGLHQHELKIGEHSWRSASPGEFWDEFRDRLDAPDVDAPPASQLAKSGPFSRWGGSAKYASKIATMLPEHKRYVEPFSGAASVLFAKERADDEVLNDFDAEVSHALKMIQKADEKLIAHLKRFNRKVRVAGWKEMLDSRPKDPVERLHRFLYLQGGSWAGVRRANPNSAKVGKDAYDPERLVRFAERLKGVRIFNLDYRAVLKKFDSPDTLFFIDPPWSEEWTDAADDIGKRDEFDLDELVKVVRALKGQWICELGDHDEHRAALKAMGSKQFTIATSEVRSEVGGGIKQARRYFATNIATACREAETKADITTEDLVTEGGALVPSQDGPGKQLSVEDIDPVRLRQLSEEEFKTTVARVDSAYVSGFKGNDKTTLRGLSREDVVNAALFVLDEAKRRDRDIKLDNALVDEVQQLRQKAAEDPEYATIHASGEEQGDVLKLDEVLSHLKSFKLRMPLLYLVGGLANRGETPNDIDLLIKGPMSPALRHVLEFRIGRMFPPELSRRIQFLDDEFGGPFTRHVELADLVVEMRPQFDVKQMALAKQDDPLLDLPKQRGPRPAILQYHFRGKSLHADLRLQVSDFLVGWTLSNQRAGAIRQPVDTVANARRIAQSFSLDGDRFTKPMRAPAKLFATPKSRQPLIWLGIDNRVFEEGEVGATRNEEGVMVIASKPKVEFGLQKSFSHEYFFTGKGSELRGTMFFRQLVGKADDGDGGKTPTGEAFWTSWVSKELMPSVLGRRAVKTKSMPPDGHSAIPISLERVTPKEFRYWERKGNEARTVRDALVDERFFTDDNIKLVDGQYKRVVTEKKFFVPADLPDDAAVEELPRRKQTVEILQKYVGGRDLAIVVPVGLPFEEWSDYFALCAKQNDGAVLVTTPPHPQSEGNEDAIVDAIVGVTTDFIVELPNSAYALAALAKIGRPFRIAGKGGRLYVASLPPASKVDIEWIDLADATYALGGQTSSWTKLKLARIVNAIVHGRDSVKDSPGVWNYFGAVGPIPKADTGKWKETVEVGGKLYVPIGTTGNSKVDAKVGDVIIAEVSEILFTETEPFRLRWFGPASVVKLSDRKSSSGIQEVLDLLEPGERKKSMSPDDELLLGERVVKVVRPKDAEERYVLGIVLEPETIDAQRDIYSHEEVRQVAHKFMERFQNIGLMHQTVINSRVKILESFLAPSDFKVGRQLVKRGTWLLAVRIKDDDLWKKVKTEGLTGFSIGGSAVRVPDA